MPAELLAQQRWVCWAGTKAADGRFDKSPVDPSNGRMARSNDSTTWGSFEMASTLVLADVGHRGVGFVLTDSDFWALDLDHVIDLSTGELAPSARRFLNSLTPTYIERSPSGDGLHVIYRGRRPSALQSTTASDTFGAGQHLEVFGGSSSRYITVTGETWDDASNLSEASEESVEAVVAMFPAKAAAQNLTPTLVAAESADELERKARRALQRVPADDYYVWLFTGMALSSTFADATARAIWDEWSRRSSKFSEEEQEKHWRSFTNRTGGKSIAYVFWLAKQFEPDWFQRWREEEQARHPVVGSRSPTPSVSSVSSCSEGTTNPDEATAPRKPASVSSVSGSPGGRPAFRPLRPLPDRLLPVPAFDTSLLPEAFRPWIEDIADRIQCPVDFPVVAAVVAFSSVVGRRIGIRPKRQDDWVVVPNLWGGPVGRPGVMKTPAMQEVMNILRDLEKDAKVEFEQKSLEYEAQRLVAKAREHLTEKQIKQDLQGGGDGLSIARSVMAQEPAAPVRKRYVTNDSTIEKLGEILKDNPYGVLVFRDELVGQLKLLDKEGNEGSRAFYLESWNGTGRFTFDRIGRGTVDIEAAIVSVLGGIQPGPLTTYLRSAERAGAGDDGLVQRFQLLVYPDVARQWVNVDRLPRTDAHRRAVAAFTAAAKLDAMSIGAQQDSPGQVPYLRFDTDAQVVFDDWRSQLEHQVRSGTDEPVIEAHLSKYRSLVPSLALLFHLADGRIGSVGVESLARAIGFAKYLEAHARRIYGLCVGGHQECHAVAAHILNGDLCDGFDSRSVYRPNWTHLPDSNAADKGLEELIGLGWLAEESRSTSGRSATVFRINPKIWDTHPRPTDRTDRSPPSAETGPPSDTESPGSAPEGTDRTDRSPPHVVEAIDGKLGDEWSTPINVIEAAREVLGGIDLDPATNPPAQQRVQAKQFFTKVDDGLLHPWSGRVWMNPPFSFPLIERFVLKLVNEYQAGSVTAAIVLTNSRTSANWFHVASAASTATCVWRGRIRFLRPTGESGASPTHGQMLFYFGPDTDAFERVFSRYGRVMITRREGAA